MGKLYQRRIDAVGFKGEEIDIIEVKPNATMSAIGQVVGYVHLYMRDEAWSKPPKAVIVTDYADADMIAVAQAQGVTVVIV
jgi:RecB family endonuclease NucS